jgi:hypothetical protein
VVSSFSPREVERPIARASVGRGATNSGQDVLMIEPVLGRWGRVVRPADESSYVLLELCGPDEQGPEGCVRLWHRRLGTADDDETNNWSTRFKMDALGEWIGPTGKYEVDWLPAPSTTDAPLRFVVRDAFTISRGTLLVGFMQSGVVRSGDEIELIGAIGSRMLRCLGVEMVNRKPYRTPPDLGILVSDLLPADVVAGDVIRSPAQR